MMSYVHIPNDLRKKSFISKIIHKEELSAAAVVISSRPHVSKRLRDDAHCCVEILGFTTEDQKSFIKESFTNSVQMEELTMYLNTNPTICSLCYIPFNLTILVWLCKQGVTLPTTSTDLYNHFICHAVRRHISITRNLSDTDNFTDLNNLPMLYKEVVQ